MNRQANAKRRMGGADPAADGQPLRILFTEGSSLSARQTLYPLGGRHQIDVIDPNPLCQCRFSSLVTRFRRSPSFAKEPVEFLQFLVNQLRKHRYDVVLPTHEQVYLLSRFQNSLSRRSGLAMPEFAALERMQNKAAFSRLLSELCLPQPSTVSIHFRREFDCPWTYPLYLKLPHSTAGSGVYRVRDRNELELRLDALDRRGIFNGRTEVLVQQPGKGVQSTVQAVFNRGTLVGVHSFESRRLGVGGMSTARVSADHTVVREHVEVIGRHLTWHGAFFLDYFYDAAHGRPEYIECNPRIGETVNAMLSGLNLPELLARISVGQSPTRQPIGRAGVRTHNVLMILMSAAHDGQSRRALIKEMQEWCAGRGLYADSEDELIRPSDDRLSRLPMIWIMLQLLLFPQIARRIVAKTVKNYELPESATDVIKRLPIDLLDSLES